MRVQDVIRGEKSNQSFSEWGSGKTPKSKFPLSKAGKKAWSLGSAWHWRFAEFECEGRRFVLRLLVCEDKATARIHLGLRSAKDTTVICCYEYHADHVTGWHLHTLCGQMNDIDQAPAGTLVHGPWVKRVPLARSPHRRTQFLLNTYGQERAGGLKPWLWSETMRFFRLEARDLLG
jgi:hypothetical protein